MTIKKVQGSAKEALERQQKDQTVNVQDELSQDQLDMLARGRQAKQELYGDGPGGLAETNAAPASTHRGNAGITVNGERKRIYLNDGRVIEMAPPADATLLVVPDMLLAHGFKLSESTHKMQIAQVLCYVRSIDGKEQPACLYKWTEVMNLVHELGELGVRACRECYEYHWSDFGGSFWSDMKSPNS